MRHILLILLMLPCVMALGQLDTARIGVEFDIHTYETGEFGVTNPTNKTIFLDIVLLNESNLSITIPYYPETLQPFESRRILFELVAPDCGVYEDRVNFVFYTNSSQRSSLNSVVQANVIGCEEESKTGIYITILFIVLIVFSIASHFYYKRKERKYLETNSADFDRKT